jgi:hypothetical protein
MRTRIVVLVVSDPAKLWESAKLVSERDLGRREGGGEVIHLNQRFVGAFLHAEAVGDEGADHILADLRPFTESLGDDLPSYPVVLS